MAIDNSLNEEHKLLEQLTYTERLQYACEYDDKPFRAWWYKHKCHRITKKLDKLYRRERNGKKKK